MSAAAAVPPAPPPPIYTRGHHSSRVRWPLLLGIFVVLLAVIVVVAGVVLKASEPAEPAPTCPTLPCAAPPEPVAGPDANAPALVAGELFSSPGSGYQIAYDPRLWEIADHDANDVEFRVGGAVIVVLQGLPASAGSPQELADARAESIKANVVSLTDVKKHAERILGPAVGYRSGAVRFLRGTLDSPQGPGTPIDVVVLAAGDGTTSVVATLVTARRVEEAAFGIFDNLMNDFRFPSEIPK